MAGVSEQLTPDQAPETLDILSSRLQEFIEACEAGGPAPRLAAFLPPDGMLRRLMLIELIKVDLSYGWQDGGHRRTLCGYLEEFPELSRASVPADLIYEEFHVRRQAGEEPDGRDYLQRFPEQADELRRLLSLDEPFRSTRLVQNHDKAALNRVVAGQTLEDFDLLAELGAGAFARVFLARQRSMQRLVALKISAERGNEPQTLAQFDHEHIVRVYDQRVADRLQLRLLYMQYVPGGTLQSVLRMRQETPAAELSGATLVSAIRLALEQRGEDPLPVSEMAEPLTEMTWTETVCWLGGRLAEALEYAHNRGTLHRDLKPANVLIARDGRPKLADFNISFCSKLTGASPAAYFGGSLPYMSPEQLKACNPRDEAEADSLDGRSDLFSLGVVLWELLTGSRPYVDQPVQGGWSATVSQLAEVRCAGPGQDALAELQTVAPSRLIRVLSRCLHPDPQQRWQSGGELARQLDLCRDSDATRLLDEPQGGVAAWVRRHPVVAAVAATAIPNLFAGAFNLAYNYQEIVGTLAPKTQEAFFRIQSSVNSVAYPIGLGLVAYLAWAIHRVAKQLERGEQVPSNVLRLTRRRTLDLGHLAAMIGLVEWTVAGFVYPIAMHLAAGSMPFESYLHFWGSLVLCGLIAASYPFFGVTCLSIHVFYPRLIANDLSGLSDVHPLEQLGRRAWAYLTIAVSVPLLAVLVLVAVRLPSRFALLVLSGGSLAGFFLVYRCFRTIQAAVETLRRITR